MNPSALTSPLAPATNLPMRCRATGRIRSVEIRQRARPDGPTYLKRRPGHTARPGSIEIGKPFDVLAARLQVLQVEDASRAGFGDAQCRTSGNGSSAKWLDGCRQTPRRDARGAHRLVLIPEQVPKHSCRDADAGYEPKQAKGGSMPDRGSARARCSGRGRTKSYSHRVSI